MRKSLAATAFLICLAAAANAKSADWHVSPAGKPANAGVQQKPWDLKSVLEGFHPEIKAGDTVWLAGGVYQVTPQGKGWERFFTSNINGAAPVGEEKSLPIIVRSMPGERAVIDGGILVRGNDVWFWGLELTTSVPRPEQEAEWGEDIQRPEGGFHTRSGQRCKFINCVVHDNNQGIGLWAEAIDSEVYGCLVYHNGWLGPDRGHGHGIYSQNHAGVKHITDNIFWDGYQFGIHVYSMNKAGTSGFNIAGNILFSNGMAASRDGCGNVILGGDQPSDRVEFTENICYQHPASDRTNVKLQLEHSIENQLIINGELTCSDNYLVNGRYALDLGCWKKITGQGNTLFGRSLLTIIPLQRLKPDQQGKYAWDNNRYFLPSWLQPFEIGVGPREENTFTSEDWPLKARVDFNSEFIASRWHAPTGARIFVRPNQYEKGRAHIAVANWERKAEIEVDLGKILEKGQAYRIFNVQTLWEKPVAEGIYQGEPIKLPALLSWLAPEFDTYLVLPLARGEAR